MDNLFICKSGIYCEKCINDKRWRTSVFKAFANPVCIKNIVNFDNSNIDKGEARCKFIKKVSFIKGGCKCKKNAFICNNKKVEEIFAHDISKKEQIEKYSVFPVGFRLENCRKESCKFYEENK